MKIKQSYIYLEQICFYSYHGVAEQERIVGNNYEINLRLAVDIEKPMLTDNVEHTVNYASVYGVLSQEMAIPSRLLEHVCGRIIERLFEDFPSINGIDIKLSKKNPPMGADIHAAGVEIQAVR